MKARLTITLDEDLLVHVDRAVQRAGAEGSRSAVIEDAVRRWARSQYEGAIRAYYRGVTPEERAEDDAWVAMSEVELASVARDAPALAPPPARRKHKRKRVR